MKSSDGSACVVLAFGFELDVRFVLTLPISMALDVGADTFGEDVIAESAKRPVMVDFWAEWCGPCRMLGPVLEKLEKDFDGRFRLVKVNTDQEQNLALRYSVTGIPDVKLFYQGEVVDGFTGAMPEPAVKRFLEANLPDPAVEAVVALAATDPVAAAEQIFDQQIRRPVVEEILWRAVIVILSKHGTADAGDLDAAHRFLGEIPELGGSHSEARGKLLAFLERHGGESEGLIQLGRLLHGEEQAALDYFLGAIEKADKGQRNDRRDDLLTCFFLGNQNPLVNEYRRKLSAVLF